MKAPCRPTIGPAVPCRGAIAELHQHNLSQSASSQGRSCMQIWLRDIEIFPLPLPRIPLPFAIHSDIGRSWIFRLSSWLDRPK